MSFSLLAADYFGIGVDLLLSGVALAALWRLWNASRADKAQTEKERKDYADRITDLVDLIEKIQELRIKEALEREDKQHLILNQYSSKLQEIANSISQLQYIVMLALHIDKQELRNQAGGAPDATAN